MSTKYVIFFLMGEEERVNEQNIFVVWISVRSKKNENDVDTKVYCS